MNELKGGKFPIEIDPKTGKIATIEDAACVKQNVKVILGTQKYERKVCPEFGTTLRSYTFEPVDKALIAGVTQTTKAAIEEWEKHIKDVNINVNSSDEGLLSKVEVAIDYTTDLSPTQERHIHTIDMNNPTKES